MWTRLGTTALLGAGALLLVSNSFIAQETHPSSISAAAEQEALKLLNDSDLAHTVTPTLQHEPCTWAHPAFPGLFPEDQGALVDATGPVPHKEPVKPDGAEYLIRFQSVKAVQLAVQRLLTLGDKWSDYAQEAWPVSPTEEPTDLTRASYNEGDMIAISVILKHVSSDGTSLFDYAYGNQGQTFSSLRWPCAGLRTTAGQTFAHASHPWAHPGGYKAMVLFFPQIVQGKPVISGAHQKVEFRMVLKQRVFETTFVVNGEDVLDGSESVLYLPNAFTALNEVRRE